MGEPQVTSGAVDGRAQQVAAALARSDVFAVLGDAARRSLAGGGSELRLAAGQLLFNAGDPADAAYLVLSGELEVAVLGDDGREVWIARIGPGELVGEMAVIDGAGRSADVRAGRRSELWRIGRNAVLQALREEPAAALQLLALLAARLRAADQRLQDTQLLDLGGRLARLLLKGHAATVSLPQGEMARLIGATRERVNKKLAEWRVAGWIETGPFGVRLLDRAGLAAAALPRPAP